MLQAMDELEKTEGIKKRNVKKKKRRKNFMSVK